MGIPGRYHNLLRHQRRPYPIYLPSLSEITDHHIRASPSKWKFFADKLPLLGHVIDDQGIHAGSEKIRGIQDWHTPKSKNELQTFIGVVIYHAQFLRHLATLSVPLSDLLSQNEFEWRPLHEEAFQQIRTLTKSITTLRPIDYQSRHPIYLFTDASKVGAGAWIGQGPSPENAHPAAFHSRKFATSQPHYPVHELELLAVVDAVQSFHPQLYGTRFTVVTDNKALSYFLSQTNLPYRQTRWRMYLQSYDFDIIHKPGKENVLADALSRVYEEQEASAEMTLVDPTEKKNIKGPYSVMASNTRHNIRLGHTINPLITQSFFSDTPLNPFSIPQCLSMWNTEDVPLPDPDQRDENNHHPGPIEQELVQMATTLEQGIEAMQSGQASIQGEPIDPSEIKILIQAAQSHLAAVASRMHSPSRHMKSSLRLNAITTALEEFMTPLPNSNQLFSPVQDTIPPPLLPLPALPQMSWNDFLCLQDIELSIGLAVCWTNAKPSWKEKTGTTTPLDTPTYLPLALSTPPHALSPLTIPNADLRIDRPSLIPLPAKMDTLSSTLSSTEVMDQSQII